MLLTLFFALSIITISANAYNILVTCVGVSTSQNLIMYRFANLLGKHGHNVTVLNWQIFPEAKSTRLANATEIIYPYVSDNETLAELRSIISDRTWSNEQSLTSQLKTIRLVVNVATSGCSRFLDDKSHPVHRKFFDAKYDVIILHTFDFCSFGLAKLVDNPSIIWLSTVYFLAPMALMAGAPFPTSYVPSGKLPITDRMTFMQRVRNFVEPIMMTTLYEYVFLAQFTKIFQSRFANFPSHPELMRETQLYFVNSDIMFDYPRPSLPNVINIGGLTMEKPEPLNEKWTEFVEKESRDGIVVFSLGSVANTELMPMDIKKALIDAFAKFTQFTFVCRIEGDIPILPDNVKVFDWLPQKDLLGNSKVRALITHCGYNSITESTYAGIPLIVIPLFGDQFANAKLVERRQIGVILDKTNLTENAVTDALTAILFDQRYQLNAKRIAQMIEQKPISSAQLAVSWVEFLAKFRTIDHILPESRRLTNIQYYSLDVIAFLSTTLLFFFYILYRIFRCICCRCRKLSTTKSKSD